MCETPIFNFTYELGTWGRKEEFGTMAFWEKMHHRENNKDIHSQVHKLGNIYFLKRH